MGKVTTSITGVPLSIKLREDGVAELIFKEEMTEAVPKGLKSLGATNYMVHIAPKTWKKIAKALETVDQENYGIRVDGEPKAAVTKKGVPYIIVIAFSVQVFEKVKKEKKGPSAEETQSQVEAQPIEETNKKKLNIPKPKVESYKPWFKYPQFKGQFIDIDVSLIDIDAPEHISSNAVFIDKKENLNPVLVRPKENGRYSLTMGVSPCATAKILGKPLKALIFEGTKEEFIKTHNIKIVESNKK